MVRIALAEDNGFLAQSLLNKLGLFDEFKVKFHALDGKELLANLASDSNVDVILMDIQMPGMNGIEATAEVAKKYPHIKVIMLTVLDDEKSIYEAIKAGGIGYLLKESTPAEIHSSIHELIGGGAPMSPSVALKAMRIIQNPSLAESSTIDFNLSERETQVLTHLCKGLNYQQIASNLIISPNTVRRHTENIYKKLGVHNKSEAVMIAYKNGLV